MIGPRSCRALAAECAGLTVLGPDPLITGLSADSRQLAPGFLFAALPGVRTSGGHFVQAALAAGAVAILHDGTLTLPPEITQLLHPEPRHALAWLAAAFQGHPSRQMTPIAITGTNGKTSTAAMIEAILHHRGDRVGVIGTTGIRYPGFNLANPLTTPDPIALQAHLRAMADGQCTAVVMEASSHALDQYRTAGITWQVAVFTHLTRDHLDYHGSERAYFESKAALFLRDAPASAVIGIAEPWGQELARRCVGRLPVATFCLADPEDGQASQEPTRAGVQRFYAEQLALSWQESRFLLRTEGETVAISLPGPGRFNVANALAAAAACWQLGVPGTIIAEGLRHFHPAPGRMETLHCGQPFAVVVDYAHTPDALERVLHSARTLTKGRILTVFGCGGERDTGKRPLMGQIAARLSEWSIVTDDNPRAEDPEAIRQAVLRDCRAEAGQVAEIPDRAQAIAHALALAAPDDTVLIAGKGHETVQITAAGVHPFDDRQTARACLAQMGFA
ncbi:MAG: UDP-N-acetylmuramoyl-L-alanyl-D-glutamate--2,6-diaminopimelate ligase [Magnetococcales bacterium]|nr:UDP-N-acetylmuramoyl-L-alanyl-D-glutamate--2,6-diaminopimelate ligase [Magnetococcales bacterium]